MFRKKKKKNLSDELFLPFFIESSESDRFFNYLHDSNSIFRERGINSEWVFGRRVSGWAAFVNQEQVDGPSGRFAPAAYAVVHELNEEGLSTMTIGSS